MILSVAIAVVVGIFGLFGFATGDFAGDRTVEARVVTGRPCDPPGAMEVVSFTVDGRERQATFDGCGHQPDEPVSITVPADLGSSPDMIVHAAGADTGEAGNGRGLGLLLLALAGVAGGCYGVLFQRTTALPMLGPFTPPNLGRLIKR